MRHLRITLAALAHGMPAAGLALALFAYWFAFANRYEVFLYAHLGATPFDGVTRSRYLMAGLVAAGAVQVLYVVATWALGLSTRRRVREYRSPLWGQVWLAAAPWIAVGVPAITMTVNWPTLPLWLALGCAGVTLIGLAPAFMPGEWAATRPGDLAWLAVDGAGLTPVLLLLIVLGPPARELLPAAVVTAAAAGALAAALLWLGVMSVLRARLARPLHDWRPLLLAGLSLAYLVLPLVHYLTASPGLHYITAATNFFTESWPIQLAIWALAALLAYGVTTLRRRAWSRV